MKILPCPFTAALLLAALIFVFPSCKKEIAGCTDPASATYNADATMDDGSCQYRGCTDPTSETYNAKATIDDGSCQYKGCTDENSLNYDAKATIDDGSCTYARDAFIGTYSATESCNDVLTVSWTMTISANADDVTKVNISNLGDYGFTIPATVDGDQLMIDATDTASGITVKGSATLNGNTLTFAYIASNSVASDDCSGTATKQ
jgi:hypothetical protein